MIGWMTRRNQGLLHFSSPKVFIYKICNMYSWYSSIYMYLLFGDPILHIFWKIPQNNDKQPMNNFTIFILGIIYNVYQAWNMLCTIWWHVEYYNILVALTQKKFLFQILKFSKNYFLQRTFFYEKKWKIFENIWE